MNIYQITTEQQRINELLEESGGELTPEIEEALLINEENLLTKVENYAYSIRKYEGASDNIAEEIKRLQALKRTADNTIERLKENIGNAMISFNRPKLDVGTFRLSFRKSEMVTIEECTELPERYQKVKIDYDRTALKNDIKNGISIPGVYLIEKQNLQIK